MGVNEKNNLEHRLIKVIKVPNTPLRREDPRGHPFMDEIIETQLPSKWKGLTIKLYDSSTDPDEHVNIFKTQMTLYTTNKALWCKVFPTSLKEEPLDWFTQLPPNFVGSFKVLTAMFTTQYATSRPHHTSFMFLLNVKQEKGSLFRAFMYRFNKFCMGIRNLVSEIAMHHLVSTIWPGRFTESLIKISAKNINELRNRATKFMQIEKHTDYHKSIQFVNEDKEKKKKKKKKDKVIRIASEKIGDTGFLVIPH